MLDRRNVLSGMAALTATASFSGAARTGASVPSGGSARNVEVIAYSELDGRPGFKLAITERRGRWYLYTGCFWHRGWNVVDVTDPARPEVVNFLPGPANTFTGQVDLHDTTMITSLEQGLANAPWGLDPKAPFEDGIIIWDLTDPVKPTQVSRYRTGSRGTHRNSYAGGRYVHLAAAAKGYDGNIYSIVDISDRAHPREAGRWSVPGQQRGAGSDKPVPERRTDTHVADFCNTDLQHVSHHGPAVIQGNVAWLAYGAAGLIVLDISNVHSPRMIGRLPYTPPFHAVLGVHSILPVPERGIAFVNSEDTSYGKGAAHFASVVDIRDPTKPTLIALFPEPLPAEGAPYGSFAERPGWSGPHNVNQLQHNPSVEKQGDLYYLTHFNAGLRIYDVSTPRLPRETGYFLPPDPRKRYGPMPEGQLVTQTEDVLVDRRGYIFITDKNQGLWVLRYTGPRARRSAT